MEHPMMKGKIDVDASNKPTSQGMTHTVVTPNDFDVDFEGEDDDKGQKEEKSEMDDGKVDLYWIQAHREKRKAAEQKELNELLSETLKQRNQELREEALRYNRERAAKKARQERLKQKARQERQSKRGWRLSAASGTSNRTQSISTRYAGIHY